MMLKFIKLMIVVLVMIVIIGLIGIIMNWLTISDALYRGLRILGVMIVIIGGGWIISRLSHSN